MNRAGLDIILLAQGGQDSAPSAILFSVRKQLSVFFYLNLDTWGWMNRVAPLYTKCHNQTESIGTLVPVIIPLNFHPKCTKLYTPRSSCNKEPREEWNNKARLQGEYSHQIQSNTRRFLSKRRPHRWTGQGSTWCGCPFYKCQQMTINDMVESNGGVNLAPINHPRAWFP